MFSNMATPLMWDFLRHTGISGLANFLYGIIKEIDMFFFFFFYKYLDNYCRYQYCANDTLFRNISSIFRSIFQDILPKKDVAFCETTNTANSCIKQKVNFSEINVSIDA